MKTIARPEPRAHETFTTEYFDLVLGEHVREHIRHQYRPVVGTSFADEHT